PLSRANRAGPQGVADFRGGSQRRHHRTDLFVLRGASRGRARSRTRLSAYAVFLVLVGLRALVSSDAHVDGADDDLDLGVGASVLGLPVDAVRGCGIGIGYPARGSRGG